MKVDLTGRVAIVTGAAQGIGAGTARRLAESGASVLVTDIQDKLGQKVAETIRQAGGEAHYQRADVSEEAQIKEMVEAAISQYGRLDIVVVIGKTGKNIPEANALEYVFGYCNANDLSARDLQMLTGQ